MEEVLLNTIPENEDMKQYLEQFMEKGDFAAVFLYESDFSNTPKLRLLIENILDAYELDQRDKNRLVLVSDELNNNAVEHGAGKSGQSLENKVMVAVKKKPGKKVHVNIEVTDNGTGKAEKMEQLKIEKDAIGFDKHHSIRGRGLFLITEKIADTLYFKDADGGGLTVGIEKSL